MIDTMRLYDWYNVLRTKYTWRAKPPKVGKWAIGISKRKGRDWMRGTENQDADVWGVRNGDLKIVSSYVFQ
jgi:hypothetical protein